MEIYENRLEVLTAMEQGWNEGAGEPISRRAIDTARMFCQTLHSAGEKMPYLYPTMEGGIQAEWEEDFSRIVVVFGPDGVVTQYDPNDEPNPEDQED